MKDLFSAQPELYARFRPHYPAALFDFLLGQVPGREVCWDCGTGNGQVAAVLSAYFKKVYATDISSNQLKHAIQKENIFYKVEPAECTTFPGHSFDLIVVAQAIHWFDFEQFYQEVQRTLKSDGLLAVIGYSLFRVNEAMNPIIDDFYANIIGPYWDPERKYLDEGYRTIPFPFEERHTPPFEMQFEWSFTELIGYLHTWSAVQHYTSIHKINPVDRLQAALQKHWDSPSMAISFPLLLRVGKARA